MAESVVIGCDHAGYSLKELLRAYLKQREIPYIDVGCFHAESVDYPDVAQKAVQQILTQQDCKQGILCCGSGVGVAIAANRFNGIRAVVCHDVRTAVMSRRHNDANVICFGARIIAAEYAQELLDTFLSTPFDGGRHQGRVKRIDVESQGESS